MLMGDLHAMDVLTARDHHESSRYPTSLSFQVTAMRARGRAGTMEARLSVRRLLRGPGALLLTSAGFFSSAPFVAALFGPSSSLSLPP